MTDMTWVACSEHEFGWIGKNRHLIGRKAEGAYELVTLCGHTANQGGIWRANYTKPQCKNCITKGGITAPNIIKKKEEDVSKGKHRGGYQPPPTKKTYSWQKDKEAREAAQKERDRIKKEAEGMENIENYGGFLNDEWGKGPRAFNTPPQHLPRRQTWSIIQGKAISGIWDAADCYMVSLMPWYVTGQCVEWAE